MAHVATLRRIRDRFRSRVLSELNECDQCPARATEPCYPGCPYVRAYHYPKG